MIKEPSIKIYPINGKITNDSFIVVDGGYFIVDNENEDGLSEITISFAYKNKNKLVKKENIGKLKLKWGKVYESMPVELIKEIAFDKNVENEYLIRVSSTNDIDIQSVKRVIIL